MIIGFSNGNFPFDDKDLFEEWSKKLEEEREMQESDEHQGRYTLEHQLLPIWAFDESLPLLESLDAYSDFLYSIACNIYEIHYGIENPYGHDEYGYTLETRDGMVCYVLEFPEPRIDTECYNAYIIVTNDARYYFTLERTVTGNMVLCSWSEDGMHEAYGYCSQEKAIDRIYKILKKESLL